MDAEQKSSKVPGSSDFPKGSLGGDAQVATRPRRSAAAVGEAKRRFMEEELDELEEHLD